MAGKRIVAVTVTYNPGEDLGPFLDSYRAQAHPDRALIIVDNASQDGTAGFLEQLDEPGIHVVQNRSNLGVAAANNQGIRLAIDLGADAVLVINNDTVFGPELFGGLHTSLDFPSVAAVSPLIPFFDDPDRIWYGGGRFVRWPGVLNVHEHDGEPVRMVGNDPFTTDYAPTCCLLFDSRVFQTVGLMDESYFVYWDDTDFAWRMNKAGQGILLDPRLTLLHKVSRSTGGALSPFTIRYANRNQILFVRKHFSWFWVGYTSLASAAIGLFNWVRGRTSASQAFLRIKAIWEGLSLPLGYGPASLETRS